MKIFDDPKSKLAGLAAGISILTAGLSMAWAPFTDHCCKHDDKNGNLLGEALTKSVFKMAGAEDLLKESRLALRKEMSDLLKG